MRLALALLAFSLATPALADCPISPKPPTYKRAKWAWEREVKRCNDRPTQWARDRCIRRLHEPE
jgi:hypothetical protein